MLPVWRIQCEHRLRLYTHLAEVYNRVPTRAGHNALNRLAKGLTPRRYMQWTDKLAENPDINIVPKVRLRQKTTLGASDCSNNAERAIDCLISEAQEDAQKEVAHFASDDIEDPFGHLNGGIDSD